MEETLISEPFTVWGLISSAGTFGAIVILVSGLLVLVSTIGLISNRSRRALYQWILGTVVKFTLLTSIVIFTAGWVKFFVIMRSGGMCFLWQNYLEDLLRGIHVLLIIALVAFGIKTLSHIKQKLIASQEAGPYCENASRVR
jgi:hypothetical protein